jgi:protein gp37
MAEHTRIAWTDHTFNIAWGCTKVSPACAHCYAEALSARFGYDVWGALAQRRTFGEKHWREPLKWNAQAEAEGRRHRVFCSSMADVFEDHPTIDEERLKLWPLIRLTPFLDWQLLTKRADRIASCLPDDWGNGWPNVWLGVTAENQEYAERRIPELLKVPAVVRFVSAEPLLGDINMMPWLRLAKFRENYERLVEQCGGERNIPVHLRCNGVEPPRLHQVIVGGESGPAFRALDLDHARRLRNQCWAAGVAFFFKQVGGLFPHSGGDLLDGERIQEMPLSSDEDVEEQREIWERLKVALDEDRLSDRKLFP